MSDRSNRRREGEDRTRKRSHAEDLHGNDDADRFTGDGPGERGYRGNEADDLPHGRVPGGSHGGGGGYAAGELIRGDENRDDRSGPGGAHTEDTGEWRTGFGAYGVGSSSTHRSSGQDPERHRRRSGRSGYAGQGFGAGESHGHNWGGGARGGYGAGSPGGDMESGSSSWGAPAERFEQGRGPRSQGSWSAYEPWSQSEFAGRGEFGTAEPDAWNDERNGRGSRASREHWNIPGPHTGRGPLGYRRSEAAIREDICDRLTRHGELDASRVSVSVEEGEVTLEGFVDSRAAKRMAEDTAESVSGVKDVHNRLRIGGTD